MKGVKPIRSGPRLAAMGALCFMTLSCAAVPDALVVPPPGVIFSHFHAPLTTQIDNPSPTTKSGTSESTFIREPFLGTSYSWGDVSIEAAAADGGVTEVVRADYEFLQVLGFFGVMRVTVHGN